MNDMTPWSLYRCLAAADAFRICSDLKVGVVTLFPNSRHAGEWGLMLKSGEETLPLCFLPDDRPEKEWSIHYICDSYVLSVPENPNQDLNQAGKKTLFPETEVSKWDKDKLWLSVPKSWADFWMPRFENQWETAFCLYEEEWRRKLG